MNKLLDPRVSTAPLILLAVGGYVLYEATSMTAFGAIFPRLAGIGLVLGSLALLARAALGKPDMRPAPDKAAPAVLLLATLMGWALLLPIIGFVPACLIGAALTMALAEPSMPRFRELALRGGGLILTILAIATLFSRGLNVPLP